MKLEDTLFGIKTEQEFLMSQRSTGKVMGWSQRIRDVDQKIQEIETKIPWMQAKLKAMREA